MKEYSNGTFCYAGYLKPGKHHMIMYDQVNDVMYYKDILVDSREHKILDSKCLFYF